MSRLLSRSTLLVATLLLASPAGASTLIDVIELEQGQNINTLAEIALFDGGPSPLFGDDGKPLYKESFFSDTPSLECDFGNATECTFKNLDESVAFVVVTAARFTALYDAPWGGEVHVDVEEWEEFVDLVNGSLRPFVPSISNIRVFSAVPEPSAALVFATGTWLLAVSIRRRAK